MMSSHFCHQSLAVNHQSFTISHQSLFISHLPRRARAAQAPSSSMWKPASTRAARASTAWAASWPLTSSSIVAPQGAARPVMSRILLPLARTSLYWTQTSEVNAPASLTNLVDGRMWIPYVLTTRRLRRTVEGGGGCSSVMAGRPRSLGGPPTGRPWPGGGGGSERRRGRLRVRVVEPVPDPLEG